MKNLFKMTAVLAVVVAYVHQNVQVGATDRGLDQALAVAGGETGAVHLDGEALLLLAAAMCPAQQMILDLLAQILSAIHGNDPQRRHIGLQLKDVFTGDFFHFGIPSPAFCVAVYAILLIIPQLSRYFHTKNTIRRQNFV